MGVYINLVEELNGEKVILTTGKYSINGMELIFDAENHVGNGVFRVSGEEAIKRVEELISYIYENENEFSATKTVNYYLEFLSNISLNKDATYVADFSEYFCCEPENKEYDPSNIVTGKKQRVQDAIFGYVDFERDDYIFSDFGSSFQELPVVKNSSCSVCDKNFVVVFISLNFTEEDNKDFLQKYPSGSDYFMGDYNKRRLFYALKDAGFEKFTLIKTEPKSFSAVFSKEYVEKWLERKQEKTVNGLLADATNRTKNPNVTIHNYEQEIEH